MSLEFFNNLKQNLEKNDTLSKLVDGVTDFIGELSEALQNVDNKNNVDIVTQIASENKLSIASENDINKVRIEVLNELANSTKNGDKFYFVFNKIDGEENYRVWEIKDNKRTQTEVNKEDLPSDANVNSVMRMEEGKLVVDKETTVKVLNEITERAKEIIDKQNKKIEDYKKDGHTYLVTEDIKGRVFLWDSTEKPKYEIEDVDFPEELKEKAKEGNSFLYQNGKYTHIS